MFLSLRNLVAAHRSSRVLRAPQIHSAVFLPFTKPKLQRLAITLGSCFFPAISLRPLRLCVRFSFPSQFRTGHARIRASRARSFEGLTAVGQPTAASNHWSLELSAYA